MARATLTPHLTATLVEELAHVATQTKVQAIKCPLCHTTIFSRARHDFRSCPCGAVSVDGGFDYMKCSWDQNRVSPPVAFELLQDATKKELYDDWNKQTERYGLIPGEPPATGADRPRTRRAPAKDRKPVSSRRKDPVRRKRTDSVHRARR